MTLKSQFAIGLQTYIFSLSKYENINLDLKSNTNNNFLNLIEYRKINCHENLLLIILIGSLIF